MLQVFPILEYARLTGILAVVGYAAYQDHKHGQVPNKTWKYSAIALPLTFAEYAYFAPVLLIPAAISIGLTFAIGLSVFYVADRFKQRWGGADTKALLTIACGMPLTPVIWQGSFLMFTPLMALFLGTVFALWVAFFKKQRNVRFIPFLLVGLILASLY